MKHTLTIPALAALAFLLFSLASPASAGVSVNINLGGGYYQPYYGGHSYPRPYAPVYHHYGRPVYRSHYAPVYYYQPRVVYVPAPYYGYSQGYSVYRPRCR